MKKFNSIKVSTVIIAVLCCLLHSAIAQTMDTNTKQWRKIHLQYIRPDMLAYWLDPAHQPVPPEYQQKTSASLQSGSPKMSNQNHVGKENGAKSNLSMPRDAGFDGRLTADDSKNDLCIFSTQPVFDQTREIAEQLDQPIQQIDLKVQAAVGDTETLKAFVSLGSPIKTDMKSAEIQSLLDRLIAQGKVKKVTFPLKMSTSSAGSASSFVSTPVVLSTLTSGVGSEIGLRSQSETPSYFIKKFYATAIPNLNNDHTVTVNLTVGATSILTQQVPLANITDAWFSKIVKNVQPAYQFLSTECTLADNQIMVVGGQRNMTMGSDGKIVNQETVWFITAHNVK